MLEFNGSQVKHGHVDLTQKKPFLAPDFGVLLIPHIEPTLFFFRLLSTLTVASDEWRNRPEVLGQGGRVRRAADSLSPLVRKAVDCRPFGKVRIITADCMSGEVGSHQLTLIFFLSRGASKIQRFLFR